MLKKCKHCGLWFETESNRATVCGDCAVVKKPHHSKTPNPDKKRIKVPTIREMMHIAAVYDFIKGTQIFNHYGEINRIIENSKPGVCVCCGNETLKYSYICSECEGKARNKKAGESI